MKVEIDELVIKLDSFKI